MIDPILNRTIWMFFLIHVIIFVCTNVFLLILNLTYLQTFWFFYPLFFWSLFLLLHFYFNKLISAGFFQKLWNDFLDKLDK